MLSTSLFTYDKETKTFSAEMSDLPKGCLAAATKKVMRYGKYVDGLVLESHVTGHWVTFYLKEIIMNKFDIEEVNGYEFELLLHDDRVKYGDLKVVIFND